MAQDNISKFYQAFNEKYDNFGSEQEFRDFLKGANRENIDNLYNAFNSAYDNFGSSDEMVSYLGWNGGETQADSYSAPEPVRTESQRRTSRFNEMARSRDAARGYTPEMKEDKKTEEWAKSVAEKRSEPAAPVQSEQTEVESQNVVLPEPTDISELYKMKEDASADYAFVDEYEKNKASLDERTKGLKSLKGDIRNSGFDPTQYNEDSAWLKENEARYGEARKKVDEIEGRIRNIENAKKRDEVEAKRSANRERLNPQEIVARGIRPSGYDNTGKKAENYSEYSAADELYAMAEQTYDQGSKYAPGYSGSGLDKAWTAVSQFVGGAANNIDKGSLTMGLSESHAFKEARNAGEKKNAIITDTYKQLGYTDESAGKLIESIESDGLKLSELTKELDAEAAEIGTMEETYKEMVSKGDPKAQSYAKEVDKRIKAYNKRVNDEYKPAYESYEKNSQEYETLLSAVEAATDKGLTDGEKEVLDAFDEYLEAKMRRSDDVSVASKAGAGAEQSAEFMLDFILTGGISKAATKAATKLTTKSLMKKLGREAVEKMAVKPTVWAQMGADVAASAARTAVMFPRNLAAYGEQLTQMTGGKDSLGRYQFDRTRLNAALNTALTQYIEYWSEGFGEYFGAGEQWLFKQATKLSPRTAIGKTLGQYRGSIGKYLDYGKFDGMFNEMVEEVVGSGFNALAGWMSGDRVGDSEAMKDFFSGEQLATLALSFLPMSAISAGTNLRAYNRMRERYNKGAEMLNGYVESGAVNREELDELVSKLPDMTPEEIKDKVVSIADGARKQNNGRLPEDFSQNLMGYLEGSFAMNLRNDEWESSANKMVVVNAYTNQYEVPDVNNAYDLAQEESAAKQAAVDAGFSEQELEENDAYLLAQKASALEALEPERAQALMGYAVAKAQSSGLKDGYDEETKQIISSVEEPILNLADNNGKLTTAQNADGQLVYLTSKDAKVENGSVVAPTGPDGLVTYLDEYGNTQTAKANTLSGAQQVDTETYLMDMELRFNEEREAEYQQALNAVSSQAKAESLVPLVNHTILIEDAETGEVSSVTVLGVNRNTGMATIKDASGRGPSRSISAELLYDSAQKDENGGISLDVTAPDNRQDTGTTESETNLENLIGTNVAITDRNGEQVNAFVTEVGGGNVSYEYQDTEGNTKSKSVPVAEFQSAMQGQAAPAATPAPAAEPAPATAPEVVEETPAQETAQGEIPIDEATGEPIYDAEGVTPEQAYNDIYGRFGEDTSDADSFVLEQSTAADKALKKAQKAAEKAEKEKAEIDKWKRNPGEGLNAFAKRKADAKAEVDNKTAKATESIPELQRKSDFWKEIREVAEANIAEAKEEAERQKIIEQYGVDTSGFNLEPQTMEEALADGLAKFFKGGGRLSLGSVLDLVGWNKYNDLRKGGYGFVLSRKPEAVPVDKFVLEIADEYPGYIKDEQDAINMVGDLLMRNTRGELGQFIFNARLNEARNQETQESVLVEETPIEEPVVEEAPVQEETPVEEPAAPVEDLPEDLPEETVEEEPTPEVPVEEPAPAPAPRQEIELRPGDILLDDLANVIDPWVVERLKDVGYNTAMETLDVLEKDMGALSLDSELDFDILTEVRDILRRELSGRRNESGNNEEVRSSEGRASEESVREAVTNERTLSPADIIEIFNNRSETSVADRGKPGRKEIIEALYEANSEMVEFRNEQDQRNAISDVVALALQHPDLEISKIIIGRLTSVPKVQEAPTIETAQESENKPENTSETPENSVTSQKEEKTVEETPAPVVERELTEEEIRNSGYPDEDVIDAAIDYINGDRSISSTAAYNLVKEYVRPQRNATEQTGGNADGTQLDGPVVQPTGVGAERSGGEGGELGGSAQGGTAERIPGNPNGGVSAGERGTARTAGVGRQSDVPDSGSNVRGGRGGSRESGRPNADVPAENGTPSQSGQPAGRTEAGSTDIAALGGELEDLLKQFADTNYSIDRDINGLDSVSYSVEPEQKEEGALSRKQPKKPTVPLSFEGLTPKQVELAGKIIFSSAKLGYAYAKTEGLTSFNDFRRWFKSKFGDAVMKGLNYDESSLDAFINEVWNTKLKIDGQRLTLEQHASELHNEELRNNSGLTPAERTRLQKEANEKKIPFKAADRKNIAEALPQLNPGQWDDLVAIERQFYDPSHNDYDHAYGKGMLITNGTGTGKTYTGLGTIKRFVDQGKGRILLVAPAGMTTEWVDKGNAMGIKMSKLDDTKDKGEGVVVTSYQNFRENKALYEDDFDLVVYDESHNILENQAGDETIAYEAHKRITNKNVDEATERLVRAHTVPGRRLTELEKEDKALATEAKKKTTKQARQIEIEMRQEEIANEISQLNPQINALKPQFRERAEKAVDKTKVLFLSATPFNTIENLKYAEGYIFQYPRVFRSDKTEITDEDGRKSAFMTEWFRGDEPMEEREIAFGDHLLDDLETVSFRELENGYDHSRDFPDVSGNIMASRFNFAFQSIMRNPKYTPLKQFADSLFGNSTWTTQLYETMKASALRDRLKEHLDAGRKIVIFHDRMHESKASDKLPAVGPPFQTILDMAMFSDNAPLASIMAFKQEFADILKWEAGLDYRPVQEQVVDFYATDADRAKYAKKMEQYDKKMEEWRKECDAYEKAHPNMEPEELFANLPKPPKKPQLEAESVAIYNGEKTDKEKEAAKAAFNDDNSKVKIICVTTRSGGAGLSLHDTTGKHPRVMIQTALPVSPIGFIQAEGRIFRWGNKSNAAFEYPRLGLDVEAMKFAMDFNAKAETVENLAHGFRGRGLKDSIMTGFYENSGNVPIAGQGIGGVQMDKRGNTLKGMAKAKHDYGVAQRKGIKAGDKSIPETIGYVLSGWGNMQSGDQALIPFAGRGSIARYMPKGVSVSALEQDIALQADLFVTSGGDDFKLREGTFTELNPINKADVVILNGNTDGGLNQIETMRKGFLHLSEGGRLIAIVPNAEKEIEFTIKDLEGQGAVLRSTILVNNSAIDAGNEGVSRIIVVDKVSKPAMRATAGKPTVHDLTKAEKEGVPALIEAIKMPERIIDKQAIAIKKIKTVLTELRKNKMFGAINIYDENGARARIGFEMANRLPKGTNQSKYRFDSLSNRGFYYTGKWFQIPYSDFEKVSEHNYLITAYQWLKEVVALPDDAFIRKAEVESSANKETIDAFRDMYRLYMKFIRAGFGLTEAQIQRVASGLQPDISAADIDTLNSYPELRAKFEAANHGDDERQDLYDKVAQVGEKIGLTIGAQAMDRDFLGGYNNKDNTLMVNKNRWNGLSDEKRAQTLLHEFIHSVTVYALAGYNANAAGMSDALFDAAKLAADVYDQITKGEAVDVRPFTGQYSIENEKELLAEMANSETKEKLKNRRMWVVRTPRGTRVSGSVMDGAEQTTAWNLLNEALDGMLKNFDKDLFDRFRGRVSDFFFELDREGGYTRDADLGAADMRENGPVVESTEDEKGGTPSADENGAVFREETDADILDRLESEPKITAYRAMQFVPDPNGEWEFDLGDGKGVQKGNLYPPMSAKVNGKWRNPVRRQAWERSVEQPELAREDGTFLLDKGNKKSVPAAYNPYFHSSATMLNDQFAEAQSRDNLVVVEVEIPEREVSARNINPYKAEKAKDAVGVHEWKAGPIQGQLSGTRSVYLSRWDKPMRIVPVDEVAYNVEKMIRGQVDVMPSNVVWPQLREELEKLGVKFVETNNQGKLANGKYYASEYKKTRTKQEQKAAKQAKDERAAESERIRQAEILATDKTLDRMGEELGVKINKVSRSEMPAGHSSDKGYYNPATGEMTICMDNVTDERDAIATVLHETVGHKGLRELFGPRFREAMKNIYAALDAKGRAWVNSYITRHNLGFGNEGIIRGMEEYLSHLAESGDFKDTVWGRIKEVLGKIVDLVFGTDGFVFTDRELNYILRASYEHLKDPNWLNTIPGKAKDTLWKRELGINETDPNRPTDPDGPGTGILFRDGDTGYANEDYNNEVELWQNKAIMENQNADLPVKIGMDKVMKETGKDTLSDDEDYLTRHNLASSRAETEAHNFELFHFRPMLEQVRAIQSALLGGKTDKDSRQKAYERVLDYIYAVSGLERNAYKNAEIEQEKQNLLQNETDPDKIAKITAKYDAMKKDWSGITSLMGRPAAEWQEAEADAQDMVDAFKREVGNDAMLDTLWDRIRSCTDFSLEHAYRHGLLTRDEFEKLHGTATQPRMWDYYVPLRGFKEDTAEEEFGYSTFTQPSTNGVVVKKMSGRWTKADNPLANILNIAETEIVQGNDNWAKQALYRFTLNAGKNTLLTVTEPWFVKNPATGNWSLAEPYPNESLEDFEARMQALRSQPTPLAKKGRQGLRIDKIMVNKAHQNEHLIKLKVAGMDKMVWVNGNPALAKAVSGIGRAQNMQWLRRASRVLSNLFTTYSLDFSVKNLIRDTIYSRSSLIVKEDKAYRRQFEKNWWSNFGYGAFAFPMIRLAAQWESGELQSKNPADRTKREQQFIDFMTDGGQTGYTIINSVNQIKRDLERSMRRAGKDVSGPTVPILGHYANMVKTLNEGFELLTRFTAYQTSRDMGRSGQRSASDAKEISVNFNRRGAQSGNGVWGNIAAYLGATHYFYNAGVQGFDNFLRLYKSSPKKMGAITAGIVMMGILTPLINSMLAGAAGGGDDDWYWNIPEWVRRNNIIIGTGRTYLAVPLPVEFRAIYGLGDIAASAFAYQKYPNRSFGRIAGDMISTAAGILPVNPVEGYTGNGNLGDAALRAVAPDAGMFFVDWATNRDYTGRPLWKDNPFSDTVPKSQGAYASTPKGIVNACQKLAEVSAGAIDVPPGLVRDFMNNYGGGFFRAAEDVSKMMTGAIGNDPERPFRWDNVPFFSGFTGHIDEDRSNSFATNALREYKDISEDVVKKVNAICNTKDITAAMVYGDKEIPEEYASKVRVQRILSGKDYELGKMYRDGMNNQYKMKQYVRGEKAGQWYKSKEIERVGVDGLRKAWRDLREEWASMPSKTEDEKSAKAEKLLEVQDAWHEYYNAEADLAERLMDYEYGKK